MSATMLDQRPRTGRARVGAAVVSTLPAADESLGELDIVMRELIDAYHRLRELAMTRREAMKRADTATLASVIEREAAIVQGIAETEKKRIRVVGGLSERLGSGEKSQTTVTWIAQRAQEPVRGTLLERARTLRELISEVKELNETAKAAAEMLATHMQGLMRQVQGKVNRAQTYGRLGTMDTKTSAGRNLDITS